MWIASLSMISGLILVVLNVISGFEGRRSLARLNQLSIQGYSYIGGEHFLELPLLLDTKVNAIQRNHFDSSHLEEQWSALAPHAPGYGHVRLGSEGPMFLVALYDQLDCLETLRHILDAGSCTNKSAAWVDEHVYHCLSTLRQAVLCNADITLEPSIEITLANGSISPAASGLDVEHECRDETQLKDFIEDNRVKWLGKPLPADGL
ncbi:hypothetical protein PLICRDRAFT_55192 [Plicaturopsis crispa FD-325 SS-3]|nr:hypothetical protein PLICRDRAFT_55192 [Plicaturopsis crispa FD-325 SS-3]